VDDVTEAMMMAALYETSNGQIYNLGGPERINFKDLASLMITVHDKGEYNLIPFPDQRKAIDIGDYYADYEKIVQDLKWHCRTPLEKGLEKTLAYYKNHIGNYL
jgi:nucleoside-diphosphate-sugar epimerase